LKKVAQLEIAYPNVVSETILKEVKEAVLGILPIKSRRSHEKELKMF
jgi:hypothetical protein